MKLGGLSIIDEMYHSVAAFLKGRIGGAVYLAERAVDSDAEDAVIVFQSATAQQFQLGLARVNIYISDIEHQGAFYCDLDRCIDVEGLGEGIIDALNVSRGEYWFSLAEAPHTIKIPDTDAHAHVVSIPIQFKRVTF